MHIRCIKCRCKMTEKARFAFNGYWYQRYQCLCNSHKCYYYDDVRLGPVDTKSDRDMWEADASQGFY